MPLSSASSLGDVLTSTTQLLSHFSNLLSNPPSISSFTSNQTSSNAIDPLKTLNDAAALLKAHSTKLGLLLLNKPFTPSAVIKVLSEITGTCLPAMMSALEIIHSSASWRFGICVEKEVRSRVRQVVSVVGELVDDIRQVAAAEEATSSSSGNKDGKKAAEVRLRKQNNSTLASTAQTWSASDALLAPALSPPSIVVAKAESYRALLRDAIEELKEWAEDEDEGFDDGEVSDQDSDVQFGPSKCPSGNIELKALVESSAKTLGMCEVGIKALGKKRLKGFKFPAEDGEQQRKKIQRLDTVLNRLGNVPEEADELAGKFYELDAPGAEKQLQRCCETTIETLDMVRDGWDGAEEDKSFAEWVDKWKGLLQRV